MKPLKITLKDKQFHVEDYPNAEKVVALRHPKAKWFADLALHQHDLEFAIACLEKLKPATCEEIVREALWRSAIINVMKCFDSTGMRAPLDPNALYGHEAVAVQVYEYFKKLRNKHLVHDENAWIQCQAAVILNKKSDHRKIADVSCFTFRMVTLTQPDFNNVWLLATTARTWVLRELDSLNQSIMEELEIEDQDALLSLPTLQISFPDRTKIGIKRAIQCRSSVAKGDLPHHGGGS